MGRKYAEISVYKSKKEAHLKKMIPVKRAKLDGKALQRDEIIQKIKELEEVRYLIRLISIKLENLEPSGAKKHPGEA